MLAMQHWKRFLDGLSDQLRDKAFDCCTIQDWKLSVYDTGIKDPDFGQLKKHILTKAQSTKKMIYNKECAIKGYEDLKDSVASIIRPATPPTPPAPMTSPTPTPVTPDPMTELTKQFSQLALLMQANIEGNYPPVILFNIASISTPTSTTCSFGDRPQCCMYYTVVSTSDGLNAKNFKKPFVNPTTFTMKT